jgi:hypothetical protein
MPCFSLYKYACFNVPSSFNCMFNGCGSIGMFKLMRGAGFHIVSSYTMTTTTGVSTLSVCSFAFNLYRFLLLLHCFNLSL